MADAERFRARSGPSLHAFGRLGTVDCEVETIEKDRSLAYRWDTKDLTSVVTWTLVPTNGGTSLRMEQRGFKADQKSYYQGATVGWRRFIDQLAEVVAKLD